MIESEHLHYKEVVKVAESMVFGMDMVGQILAYTPNIAKAKAAAEKGGGIFGDLNRKSDNANKFEFSSSNLQRQLGP